MRVPVVGRAQTLPVLATSSPGGYVCDIDAGVELFDLRLRPLQKVVKPVKGIVAPFLVDDDHLAVVITRRKTRQLALVRRADVSRLASVHANGALIERPPQDEVDARRLATFRSILGTLRQGRLLDLGAGHGAFSLIAAELGWTVTAVDARTTRMPMTEGVEWVEADVRDYDPSGFDCIALLGLLYHLELDAQLDLLRRCAGTTLILDTHHALVPQVSERGYDGRLYQEPGSTDDERRGIATASWGNPQSFWATRDSLIRMLNDTGHPVVLALEPQITPDRTFYLCP